MEGKYKLEYPVAFHTVDIAITRLYNEPGSIDMLPRRQILMVQKVKEILQGVTVWRFPGGFVDPTDDSAEGAAIRESGEETHMTLVNGTLEYVGSSRIDDPRYRDSDHKIITSLFSATWEKGETGDGEFDDVGRIKWFYLDELVEKKGRIVNEIHLPLLSMLEHKYKVELNIGKAAGHVEEFFGDVEKHLSDFHDGISEKISKFTSKLESTINEMKTKK